jgi:hypothetical protein
LSVILSPQYQFGTLVATLGEAKKSLLLRETPYKNMKQHGEIKMRTYGIIQPRFGFCTKVLPRRGGSMRIIWPRKLLIWATLSLLFVLMLGSKTYAATEVKLLASDAAVNVKDVFGYSVSISGDVALVGAYGDDYGSGSAYVYALEVQPGQATLVSPSGTIDDSTPT